MEPILEILKITSVAGASLFIGDFISTFAYHVPEHVWGGVHCRVHHSPNRSFVHYAVLTGNPWVVLDGFLGALPYLATAWLFWYVSPVGAILSLALGQLHVWWRHIGYLGWETPDNVLRICQLMGITSPEKHWQHHENGNIAFGDIFTIFDFPAQKWLGFLRGIKKNWK